MGCTPGFMARASWITDSQPNVRGRRVPTTSPRRNERAVNLIVPLNAVVTYASSKLLTNSWLKFVARERKCAQQLRREAIVHSFGLRMNLLPRSVTETEGNSYMCILVILSSLCACNSKNIYRVINITRNFTGIYLYTVCVLMFHLRNYYSCNPQSIYDEVLIDKLHINDDEKFMIMTHLSLLFS